MAPHKVIISCAVTGSIHTPSMSPHLPVTAAEIADSALGAAAAGAAIVHLHARNPVDGRPDQSPEAFEPFLCVIKQSSNVVVNLTTGGSPYMTVEERVRPAATWKPEIASLNMGSMNFGLFPMLKRYKSFKYDWEPQMLEGSHDLVFRNSFKDIRYALETLNGTGARYEFECYDTSHLYNLHYFWTEGLVKAPLFIQTCFGLLGGIGSHADDVMHMKRTADRLFGDNYRWSVLGAGRAQMQVAAMAAAMGGNVRVGLEDSLWIGAGRLAETNATQVTQVRKIIEGLGLEIASPDEARDILRLKGGDKVAFKFQQTVRRTCCQIARSTTKNTPCCATASAASLRPESNRASRNGKRPGSSTVRCGPQPARPACSARRCPSNMAASVAISGTMPSSSRSSPIPVSPVPRPISPSITTSAAAIF